MTVHEMQRAFHAISLQMTRSRDYLIELDSQNGDGDLGIYMDLGFKAVDEALAATGETDLGKLFLLCGKTLNEAAPSSLGTILSLMLMGMAKPLKGQNEITLAQLGEAMGAGMAAIERKAGSKRGEKTVLDAIGPAVDAVQANADRPVGECFALAARAAAEGSEKTREMLAVHGRAAVVDLLGHRRVFIILRPDAGLCGRSPCRR